jgi:transposase InsO family protein
VKFAFIKERLRSFPADVSCDVLEVSRSGYYAWAARPSGGVRQRRRAELLMKVRATHAANRAVYGSPRVCAALRAAGERVSENTVARVMREHGIRAKTKKTYVPRTTDSVHQQPVAANVLDRQFTAELPDQKWAVDITYVPTDQGWLYLAGVIDLCSRRIVGWSMAEHLRTELVLDALDMAIAQRQPGAGLVHHSDHGCQYTSLSFGRRLRTAGLVASMGTVGDALDNAVAESFFATLECELLDRYDWPSRQALRTAVFDFIEVFDNRQRRHSTLDYLTPIDYEHQHPSPAPAA